MYIKALVILACFVFGALLLAIAVFGMTGVWERFLFISLRPLQESLEWPVGLIVVGLLPWLFGATLLRTS